MAMSFIQKNPLESLILMISLKKIIKHYKRVEYSMNVMRRSACLVINPITVYSYGLLFIGTPVGQASRIGDTDIKL